MKHITGFLFLIMVMALLSPVMVFAGGQQGQTASGPAATPTGRLPVTPQYGEEKRYPKPATGWTANPKYPQQPPISGVNEYPIVGNKVTMRIAIPYYSYVTDYENNDLTRYMEELTNVHIDWELLPEVGPLEKVNLMFAAGDALPDVFAGCAIPTTMQITLGTSGLILSLQDLIERNGFNMKTLFSEQVSVYPMMTSADGNVYSLAGYAPNEANKLAMRFWINKTFLDTLGMKMPTTTDEYYEYLKAVKTRDPNKNGRADEIPLVGATEGWHAEIDGFLMNAFAYNETSTDRNPDMRRRIYLTGNGKIETSFNKPEWKQGLEYMHKLYAEGLLAGESFTLTKADLRSLVEYEGALIVGSLPNGGPHEFANTQGERRKDFAVLPPLKGPNGIQQAWWDEYAGPAPGNFIITRDCKIPDIAIKWVDYCFTEDFRSRNRYGVLGRDWKIPPSGVESVAGGPALYEEILKWGTPQNAYWGGNFPTWATWASYNRAKSSDPYELEVVLYDAYQKYRPYVFKKSVPFNLAFTLDEARRYSELNRLIVEYVEQSIARFVTGDLDLNRDWDRYLGDLNRMGLNDLLSITQAAFDRQWKSALGY